MDSNDHAFPSTENIVCPKNSKQLHDYIEFDEINHILSVYHTFLINPNSPNNTFFLNKGVKENTFSITCVCTYVIRGMNKRRTTVKSIKNRIIFSVALLP